MRYNVFGAYEQSTSFGLTSKFVCEALLKAGHDVVAVVQDNGGVADRLLHPACPKWLKTKAGQPQPKAKNVCVFPIGWPYYKTHAKGSTVVTVWETDKLHPRDVKWLNEAKKVITFTAWGKRVMEQSGVSVPIAIMPLGVDKRYVLSKEMPVGKTFLTAGRCWSGNRRKGVGNVIAAFLGHAERHADTRLVIKAAECDPLEFSHPRVQIIKQQVPVEEMMRLYAHSFCYVSGALSEGWGWHQHEAMMCGRPVIGTTYGGMGEFFKGNEHGYAVRYGMEKADDEYHASGRWTVPSLDDMVAAMNKAAADPYDAMMRGLKAHMAVQHMTADLMYRNFAKLI